MPFPRRKPARIALDLFDCIDERNGMASKWDLIKVVGMSLNFITGLRSFCLKTSLLRNNESQIVFLQKN